MGKTASSTIAGTSARQRWALTGSVTGVAGMVCWVGGVGKIPPDAKLASGDRRPAALLADNAPRPYLASLLAIAGGVLLVTLFAALAAQRSPGSGTLRLALAACVMTQTVVGVGDGFAMVGIHSAVTGALGWVSAVARVIVLGTVAQSGIFTPDGIVGAVTPLTTVVWILAVSAVLPSRVRRGTVRSLPA